MNTTDPFLQWLLSASLLASVLALAVLGLQMGFRCWLPARWRHALWLPVALTLAGVTRAQDAPADQVGKNAVSPQSTEMKDKAGYGKFVSFKDGTLKLKGNSSGLVWNGIPTETPVLRWDDAAGKYAPSGTAEVMSKVEAGTWIIVSEKMALIRIGARKDRTTGTFVSYKDGRLLMLGTNLGGSYVKKYGNQIRFNKFAEGVPVFESIDGGAFEPAGTAETALPKVKEGTILTVYGEGDDNIVRIEIGAPKNK